MDDDKPSHALDEFSCREIFNLYPFTLLSALKVTRQSPKHHPEGDVWKHTLMVVDEAAKQKKKAKSLGFSCGPPSFMTSESLLQPRLKKDE